MPIRSAMIARTPLSGMRSATSAAGSGAGTAASSAAVGAAGAPAGRAALGAAALHRAASDVFPGDLAAGPGAGDLAQVDAGFGGQLLGQRRGLRRGRQVGQHVALGDAHAAAAGRRDLRDRSTPLLLRPACARAGRRRPRCRPPRSRRWLGRPSPARQPRRSAAPRGSARLLRRPCAPTNLSSGLPMTATTSSTGHGVARLVRARDAPCRPPRTRRRRSSCRSRSPGSPGPS